MQIPCPHRTFICLTNVPCIIRYDPYSHLSAPYVHAFAHLYVPLTEGERVKIARLLVTGDKHFKGDAKGCGLDIDKLQVCDNIVSSSSYFFGNYIIGLNHDCGVVGRGRPSFRRDSRRRSCKKRWSVCGCFVQVLRRLVSTAQHGAQKRLVGEVDSV